MMALVTLWTGAGVFRGSFCLTQRRKGAKGGEGVGWLALCACNLAFFGGQIPLPLRGRCGVAIGSTGSASLLPWLHSMAPSGPVAEFGSTYVDYSISDVGATHARRQLQ
jgi:hypothetical protein